MSVWRIFIILFLAAQFCPQAQASIVDRVVLSYSEMALVKQLPADTGEMKFLVASNSPFKIMSEGMIGEISIDVTHYGRDGRLNAGSVAQLPTNAQACSVVMSTFETPIYISDRKTAARAGRHIDQAVLVTLTHNPSYVPDITIRPVETATPILSETC